MTEKNTDQEFVEYVVRLIVKNPQDVVVERKIDERGVLLTLKVNPEDMGLIIGKNGSTAIAIRNLARIIGIRNGAHVNFKIEEPEGSTRGELPMEKPSRILDKVGTSTSDEMESVVEELKS